MLACADLTHHPALCVMGMPTPHVNPFRVLITGVGSLVGTGILDALEGRRDSLFVIGTSFGADAPGVYRCDQAFFTRHSEGEGFEAEVEAIIARTQPDVVIPGRDPDITAVARLAERLPALRAMVGGTSAAVLFADKLATFEFARSVGLPVVATRLATDGPITPPAVVKPRFGSGSIGVRILLNRAQVEAVCQEEDAILQPLIGPAPQMPDVTVGWPLFWQCLPARQGGVQGLILPDGSVGPSFAFEVTHEAGKVARQWAVEDDELTTLGQGYLRAIGSAGWRGPANIACVHSGSEWLCLELNGRFTGGTAARTAMGYDEVGIALNAWAGREVAPARAPTMTGQATMRPGVSVVVTADRDSFLKQGIWP